MSPRSLPAVFAALAALLAVSACGTKQDVTGAPGVAPLLGEFTTTQELYLYDECLPGLFVACRSQRPPAFMLMTHPVTTYRADEDGAMTPTLYEPGHVLPDGSTIVIGSVERGSSMTAADALYPRGYALDPQARRFEVMYMEILQGQPLREVRSVPPSWIRRIEE